MRVAILAWNIGHPGRFIHGINAKMPPSWLSQHLRCCCRKRRCDECSGKLGHTGTHHCRLVDDAALEDNHELDPFAGAHRHHLATAPVNPFLNIPSRNSFVDGYAR
jgi:hypothetical protein